MICTYLFWKKKTNSFLQLNCRYSKANNFSQVVHGLFKIIAERIHIFEVAQGTGFDIIIRNYLYHLINNKLFFLFSGKLYSDDT